MMLRLHQVLQVLVERLHAASARPVWIAEYICAILFSRIRLRIAGVPTMISCAAHAAGAVLGLAAGSAR